MLWKDGVPAEVRAGRPIVWWNDRGAAPAPPTVDVDEALREVAWGRPFLRAIFPELEATEGRIESPLIPLGGGGWSVPGPLYAKADHALPLTGSVKARGGMYEVLGHAKEVACAAGLLPEGTSSELLASDAARTLFAARRIAVGSTGNLGYSIGILGRALGFAVVVHMSRDAKAWKKARLRDIGATVIEHEGDYAAAVASAREASRADPSSYFVDDESSLPLFKGYMCGGLELADQLAAFGLVPLPERPLDVLIPCGVGGAPAGIAYGLKHAYGEAVRLILVEPTQSPCVLIRLAGLGVMKSVYDVGLTNATLADGLAVPSASELACAMAGALIGSVVTVSDESLLAACRAAWRDHGLKLELSGAAGLAALGAFYNDLRRRGGPDPTATIVWTTGGAHLPEFEFRAMLAAAGTSAAQVD
ncbi:D-serine ammonia-lyase [Enterovirga aerilata]|uniref:Probable D-serine dehydratase n=1 Tax=Enterovirga aerilata TaxID=2730920 RepID=A0A849I0F5_9HYPH|nr:D-serine ammonia-lyase [Enterovirga sp. DB1703]NNM70881.1 D-serine ammonia-lyase [Enterovirga sp. DB1703]